MRSRLLRPGYSLTTLTVALSTDSRTVRFLPACCPSYGVLTFSPAGLLSFLLNISALPGRTKSWRSQAYRAVA